MKRPLLWILFPVCCLPAIWLATRPVQETSLAEPAVPAPRPAASADQPARGSSPASSGAPAGKPVPAQLERIAPLAAARARMTSPGVDRRKALRDYRQEFDRQLARARRDIRPFVDALQDSEPAVRMQAIVVLTELGGEAALRALAGALEREAVTGLQLALLHGLSRLGGPVAHEALVAQYRRMAGSAHRYHVVRALGVLADAGAIPVLAEALQESGDPSLRAHAAGALAQVGGSEARRLLEQARDAETHAAVAAAIRRALARRN